MQSLTDIKLSKCQLSKMIQSGGFFGRLLNPLLKTGLPLLKNVINSLAESVWFPLGLTAAVSAADAGIHNKILGLGKHPSDSSSHNNTILIILSNEMKEIIEIVKSLEDPGLSFKGVSERIQNEANEQRGGFLSMFLGTLGASLLGNILVGKGINRAREGIVKVGYGNKKSQKKTMKRQDHENKMFF